VALHSLPLDDDADAAALPTVDPVATLAQAGVGGRELAWIESNVPEPRPAVLCHGGYQPLVVSGDPTAGQPLTVRNWAAATRAEPEYDVAFTLLAFWSAPYYTGTRTERAGLKMIRDMLTNVYRGSYEAQRPLDADRVRFWHCFHALRGAADPTVPADLAAALPKRFWKLTKGAK
jgi:aminoglycoside phosphotransferase (APT) family kinase protein